MLTSSNDDDALKLVATLDGGFQSKHAQAMTALCLAEVLFPAEFQRKHAQAMTFSLSSSNFAFFSCFNVSTLKR